MSNEIKVQSKNKKTKLIVAIVAAVIVVLTIVAIVLASSSGATAQKVKEQLSLGDKYLSELNYEQAIVAYELAIEIDPKCEDAYLALAEIYIETGEFEKAEEILEKAEEALGKETEGIKSLREKIQRGGGSEQLSTDILKYEIMKDGNIRILGLADTSLTELVIPEQIEGRAVTEIGSYAFSSGCLNEVKIQNGVECIGEFAFGNCDGLRCVVLPDTVTVIEDKAFNGCSNLNSVKIPNNKVSFGVGAFDYCNEKFMFEVDLQNEYYVLVEGILYTEDKKELVKMPLGAVKKEFHIPEGVVTVGNSAFFLCGIEKIAFPSSLVHIGDEAFFGNNFEKITLPDKLESMGCCVFKMCSNLCEIEISSNNQYFMVVDNVVFSKDMTKLVLMPAHHKKYSWAQSYQIPSTVTTIGKGAFFNASMESLVIPEGVTVIERHAFNYHSIAEISLPASLMIIEGDAFLSSWELESIVIPGNVRVIEDYAFYYCKNLKKVVIQEGVTSIGAYAFAECSNACVEVPDSVTELGNGAFLGVKEIIVTPGSKVAEYAEKYKKSLQFEVRYR